MIAGFVRCGFTAVIAAITLNGNAAAQWERHTLMSVDDSRDGIVRLSFRDGSSVELSVVVPRSISEQRLHSVLLAKQHVFFSHAEYPQLSFVFDQETRQHVEVSTLLVAHGLALSLSNHPRASSFEAAKRLAQSTRVGLWGNNCMSSERATRTSTLTPGHRASAIWNQVAEETGVSSKLLFAIALRESGRNGQPHPWTINVRGVGHYFSSKAEAVSFASKLLKNGEELFDVGFMQVNWRWHKHRFNSIEDSFDQLVNVRAGADILLEEYGRTRSVVRAVARYHRGSAELDSLGQNYVAGVRRNMVKLASISTKSNP
jgi:soluble lytic murein transglycosylase-like protein